MKLIIAICLFAIATTAASAKDITLTLTEDEQRALLQLLDTANKAGGLSNAEVVVFFARKIAEAQRPAPPQQPEK